MELRKPGGSWLFVRRSPMVLARSIMVSKGAWNISKSSTPRLRKRRIKKRETSVEEDGDISKTHGSIVKEIETSVGEWDGWYRAALWDVGVGFSLLSEDCGKGRT